MVTDIDLVDEDAAVPGWGRPRTRTVTWFDPDVVATAASELGGLALLRGIRDGRLPPPPMASLFGMQIVEVEVGLVRFECRPDQSAYNTMGLVHGGLVCTLADTVAACAVHTTLEPGAVPTSIDLNVSYLRPVTTASGILGATGRVTKPGRRVAYSSAEIVDGTGKLVATATSSCLVLDHRPT